MSFGNKTWDSFIRMLSSRFVELEEEVKMLHEKLDICEKGITQSVPLAGVPLSSSSQPTSEFDMNSKIIDFIKIPSNIGKIEILDKYIKMIKKGVPEGGVLNAMKRDNINSDDTVSTVLGLQLPLEEVIGSGVKLKQVSQISEENPRKPSVEEENPSHIQQPRTMIEELRHRQQGGGGLLNVDIKGDKRKREIEMIKNEIKKLEDQLLSAKQVVKNSINTRIEELKKELKQQFGKKKRRIVKKVSKKSSKRKVSKRKVSPKKTKRYSRN